MALDGAASQGDFKPNVEDLGFIVVKSPNNIGHHCYLSSTQPLEQAQDGPYKQLQLARSLFLRRSATSFQLSLSTKAARRAPYDTRRMDERRFQSHAPLDGLNQCSSDVPASSPRAHSMPISKSFGDNPLG
jgi:hypothetical protein